VSTTEGLTVTDQTPPASRLDRDRLRQEFGNIAVGALGVVLADPGRPDDVIAQDAAAVLDVIDTSVRDVRDALGIVRAE
jgi:hypothetical protein